MILTDFTHLLFSLLQIILPEQASTTRLSITRPFYCSGLPNPLEKTHDKPKTEQAIPSFRGLSALSELNHLFAFLF